MKKEKINEKIAPIMRRVMVKDPALFMGLYLIFIVLFYGISIGQDMEIEFFMNVWVEWFKRLLVTVAGIVGFKDYYSNKNFNR